MRQKEIVDELRRRTQRRLGERRLVVDYYRIRRRLAFPWPLTEMPQPTFKARSLDNYPWHTWFSWEVEERVNAMGWAAEFNSDEALRERSRKEIGSVARWPSHVSGAALDLCVGHMLRTLVLAKRNWPWLGAEVEAEIMGACKRAVEQKRAWMAENLPQFQSVNEILAAEDPDHLTRNIPLIGTTALAMAAQEAGDASAEALQLRVKTFLLARFELQGRGSSENVAYDGYVLDFIADLLPMLPVKDRQAILDHPGVKRTLDMSLQLAAPGKLLNVANLADVEPREMPFHASAHAKLVGKLPPPGSPESAWLLNRCSLEWLRSDCLAAMHDLPEQNAPAPMQHVAMGPYAVTLRTGWGEDDTAVAIGAPRGGMGHLHCDGGSIMIARGGHWLLADPGYQQYLETSERGFTLGKHAHNAPVIHGQFQTERKTKILSSGESPQGLRHVTLDLTANYPDDAKLASATRTIWLLPSGIVVIRDQIQSPAATVEYAFHGLPDASWWAADHKAVIYHEGAELWIASPNARINQCDITRLQGSRGHQSLVASLPEKSDHSLIWWIFNIGPTATPFHATDKALTLGEFTLNG